MTSCKSELLDPMGMILRLGQLSIEPVGTKLKLFNHALRSDIPSRLQAIWRTWNGDSKGDIGSLYWGVVRFINIYVLPAMKAAQENKQSNSFGGFMSDEYDSHNSSTSTSSEIKKSSDVCNNAIKGIAAIACEGLKKLQQTYGVDNYTINVVLVLQYLIGLLESTISGTYDEKKMLPECLVNAPNFKSLINDSVLRELWDDESIICTYELLNKWVSAHKSGVAIFPETFKTALLSTLDQYDDKFRQLVEVTNKA